MAITIDGEVYTWGWNGEGGLGNNAATLNVPTKVEALSKDAEGNFPIQGTVTRGYSTMIKTDGKVYVTGSAGYRYPMGLGETMINSDEVKNMHTDFIATIIPIRFYGEYGKQRKICKNLNKS